MSAARRLLAWWLVPALLVALPAEAHFRLNANIRIVHVVHVADGLEVYLRLPAPYVLAPSEAGAPPRFTRTVEGSGEPRHYVEIESLRRQPAALGQLVADGHQLSLGAEVLSAEVVAVRLFEVLRQPPFASAREARAAFDGEDLLAAAASTPAFVGDTVVDVWLRYRTQHSTARYAFASSLRPAVDATADTANLLLDHYPGGSRVFRERGLLATPIEVSRSSLRAAATFVIEGVRHILEGLDHVLFVLCLALGAARLATLAWRVTGFTLGHSVTLALGFVGFVPSGAWFVPVVEAGIAMSIAWAAIAALGDPAQRRSPCADVALPAAIGLLHGLGFSFVLAEILRADAPDLWQSLLAFNVGVEVGQLAIVVPVFILLGAVAARSARVASALRWAIAVPCLVVAGWWTTERVGEVVLG